MLLFLIIGMLIIGMRSKINFWILVFALNIRLVMIKSCLNALSTCAIVSRKMNCYIVVMLKKTIPRRKSINFPSDEDNNPEQ